MNNIQKAEFIILEKIHKTHPHLKFVLADIISGKSSQDIAKEYNLAYGTVRALKSRYKVEINGIKEKEE